MGGDGEPWGEGRAQQQDASLEKTQDLLRGGCSPGERPGWVAQGEKCLVSNLVAAQWARRSPGRRKWAWGPAAGHTLLPGAARGAWGLIPFRSSLPCHSMRALITSLCPPGWSETLSPKKKKEKVLSTDCPSTLLPVFVK